MIIYSQIVQKKMIPWSVLKTFSINLWLFQVTLKKKTIKKKLFKVKFYYWSIECQHSFFFYFIICLFSLVVHTTRAVEETLMGLHFQIYLFFILKKSPETFYIWNSLKSWKCSTVLAFNGVIVMFLMISLYFGITEKKKKKKTPQSTHTHTHIHTE